MLFRSLFLGLLSTQDAVSRIYKWVDEDGNVQYTQSRPTDRPVETIQQRSSHITDEQAEEELDAITDRAETARKDREFKEGYVDEAKAREERLQKNCEIARENLRILRTAARVQDKNEEGNLYYLDDSAKEARIAKSKEQIEANCP